MHELCANWENADPNRIVRREHYASGQTVPAEVHESRYDETRTVGPTTYWNGGQLSSTTSPWGTTQHDFDANDNKVKDTWVINSQTYAITHTIDAGGWLIAKSWSDGDSFSWALRRKRRRDGRLGREPVDRSLPRT